MCVYLCVYKCVDSAFDTKVEEPRARCGNECVMTRANRMGVLAMV